MVKVRKGLAVGDYRDPGWYKHPAGTVVYEVDAAMAGQPARHKDAPSPGEGDTPAGMKMDHEHHHCVMLRNFAARMLTNENCNLLAGVLFITLTSFAFAHEGATGVVKERMDLMKGQQKQMKLIGEMAKGKKKFDAAKAAAAARDLGKSTKKIPDLFPEGSNGHPSEALDAVWKEWDRFKGDAHDAEAAADELAKALEASGQDWKAGFKKMTDACKSCHETFRAKEEEVHHH